MEKKSELRKITREELNDVLEKHKLWIDTGCKEGERADLADTDLHGATLAHADLVVADLSHTNLSYADLSGAKSSGADLEGTNLEVANLTGTNLRGANLRYANLQYANLYSAVLSGANLIGTNLEVANLCRADLRGANLKGADLSCANLRHANLKGADLSGADLRGVDLEYANLTGVKNFPNIPMACPIKGSFIGWKHADGYIIKLEIPADAKRSSGMREQCRCNKAKVLSIENRDGTPADVTEVRSNYDPEFIYRVGETVIVDNFDDNRFNECAPGIHFYTDRESAVRY